MKLRRTVSLAVAALSLALAAPSAAHAQIAFFLRHWNEANTKMCIQPTGFMLYEQLTPVNCADQSGMMWYQDFAGFGAVPGIPGTIDLWRLRSVWSGYCVDVTNRSSSVPEGTLLEMDVCGTQRGNLWAVRANQSFGGYEFRNAGNGKCLQSYGWLDTWLVLHTCDGSYTGQRFFPYTTP